MTACNIFLRERDTLSRLYTFYLSTKEDILTKKLILINKKN